MELRTEELTKIRVLELTSTSDMGGAEKMVLNLCSALDKDEFEPHIASLIGSGELIRQAEQRGISARHLRFSSPYSLSGIRRLIRLVREWKIDIIQVHGLRADAVARWAGRLGGGKVIISTIHSIDPWRRKRHSLVDRMTAPFVDRYVAVCEAAAKTSHKREGISREKIDVVYIGVPDIAVPRGDSPKIKSQLGITGAYPVVGILANLRDMKGHKYVIEALPRLMEKFPEIRILFAGRDDSNGELERLAQDRGVSHAIKFLGFWENPSELFAVMDIFLLPSEWEGLPVSIIEAMSAGVPVIASNVGGIPELITHGESGLLIEPRNSAAIEDAVSVMMNDFALRATVIRNADAKVQSVFHVKNMAARMEIIFKETLSVSR